MGGADDAIGWFAEVMGRPTVKPPPLDADGSGDARDAVTCGDLSSWILCRMGVCCWSTGFEEPAEPDGTGLMPFAPANGE